MMLVIIFEKNFLFYLEIDLPMSFDSIEKGAFHFLSKKVDAYFFIEISLFFRKSFMFPVLFPLNTVLVSELS